MNARNCICRNRPVHTLLSAYYRRARQRLAAGVLDGQPPPTYAELRTTITLIRALAEGREKGPFQERYRHLDHHLHACPCSPHFQVQGS